jgi:3-oxo-5-alpha-steroid 4-dehydrogenase 1
MYLPGRWAWITMEVPGFLTLLYIFNTLPAELGISALPWENKAMAGMFVSSGNHSQMTDTNSSDQVIHYLYRAIIAPLIAPSMSPIHPIVWLGAIAFQLTNGLSIGGWLAGYGPITRFEWQGGVMNYKAGGRMELGLMIWALGLFGNIFHDDELREIRRAAMRNQKKRAEEAEKSTAKDKAANKGVDKVYMIPQNGLFNYIFYPHYLLEWVEWAGFWLMAGSGCVPARNFLLNEIATMLPRAIQGKKWYVDRFGEKKVNGRKAIIPGIL